jgi:hypothetical protein
VSNSISPRIDTTSDIDYPLNDNDRDEKPMIDEQNSDSPAATRAGRHTGLSCASDLFAFRKVDSFYSNQDCAFNLNGAWPYRYIDMILVLISGFIGQAGEWHP